MTITNSQLSIMFLIGGGILLCFGAYRHYKTDSAFSAIGAFIGFIFVASALIGLSMAGSAFQTKADLSSNNYTDIKEKILYQNHQGINVQLDEQNKKVVLQKENATTSVRYDKLIVTNLYMANKSNIKQIVLMKARSCGNLNGVTIVSDRKYTYIKVTYQDTKQSKVDLKIINDTLDGGKTKNDNK